MIRFFLFTLFISIISVSAHAQDAAANPYQKESGDFYAYCLEDTYLGKNFDCECLAAQFLVEREKQGPEPASPDIIAAMDMNSCAHESSVTQNLDDTETDISDIPEDAMKDSQDFYEYCQRDNLLNTRFECECYAAEYLNERIKAGPDVPRSELMVRIDNTCPNVVAAAGSAYTECLDQESFLPDNQPIGKFCRCYAETYADMRGNLKVPLTSRMRVSLKSRAMIRCRAPNP